MTHVNLLATQTQIGTTSICILLAFAISRALAGTARPIPAILIGIVFAIGIWSVITAEAGRASIVALGPILLALATGLTGITAGIISLTGACAVVLLFGQGGLSDMIPFLLAFCLTVGARPLFSRQGRAMPFGLIFALGIAASVPLISAPAWQAWLGEGVIWQPLFVSFGLSCIVTWVLGYLMWAALESVTQQDDLSQLAMTDPLTGLLNRRGLEARYAARCRAGASGTAMFILVDVDRFKDLNEAYGHQVGDLCLVRVADAMNRAMPPTALCARTGGDEFAAILFDIPDGSPARLAAMLRDALKMRVMNPDTGKSFHLTATVGHALCPAETGLEDALQAADTQMYSVKHRRNGGVGGLAIPTRRTKDPRPQIPPHLAEITVPPSAEIRPPLPG